MGVEAFVLDSFRTLEPCARTAPILTSLLLGQLKEKIWALSEKEKKPQQEEGSLAQVVAMVSFAVFNYLNAPPDEASTEAVSNSPLDWASFPI
jgi:hypothetical protein